MTHNQLQPKAIIIGAFVFVLLFSIGAFFWNLGVSAIANADEGVHALVTREIRERPDWLTMHIRGEEYFRKPPLAFWIRAATHSILGENEFTTRLPSALAGVATTMLLAVWAWQWTRRWQTVVAVGVIFPLLPSTFVHTFRTGETDGTLIFLLTLTAYVLWHSLKRPRLLILAAAITGLALMTKSVAAGVVPIGFLVALALHRRWPYTWKHVVMALAAFFVIAAPWHVIEHVRHGSTFWKEYLGEHVIERVEERLHVTPKTHGPFWYLSALERGMYPWSWLILPAIAAVGLRRRERDDVAGTFLVSWAVGTVVLFSLAATKLAWYIAPAFPAFSLLIAAMLTSNWSKWSRWLYGLIAVSFAGYAWITQREFTDGLAGIVSLSFIPTVVAVVAFGGLALLPAWRHSSSKIVAALLVLHMLGFSLIVWSRNFRSHYESPFRVFRNEIVQRDPSAQVFIFPIGYVTSPLSAIYLEGPNHQRIVTPVREDRARLEEIVAINHGSFIIFNDEHPAPVELIGVLEPVREFGELSLYHIR